jgi:hypothetical protein
LSRRGHLPFPLAPRGVVPSLAEKHETRTGGTRFCQTPRASIEGATIRRKPKLINLRGILVSTDKRNPSLLSVDAVSVLGLPEWDGTLYVDEAMLRVVYLNDAHISVWADISTDGDGAEAVWQCGIL